MTTHDQIATLMHEADTCAKQGRYSAAESCWRRVLDLEHDYAPALNFLGASALAKGDLASAARYLDRAISSAPEFAMAHANRSRVYGAQGRADKALEAITRAIAGDPTSWGAHMERARLLEAAGRRRDAAASWSLGLAYIPAAAADSPSLQPLLSQARQAVKDNQEELRTFLQDRMQGALHGCQSNSELERFRHCLDIVTGRREFVTARPLVLPYPRLPAIPFFDTSEFDWVPELEAAFPDILRELQGVLEHPQDFVPYVQTEAGAPKGQFDTLDRNLDWSALFLWKNGARIHQNADRCPITESAVRRTPQNIVNGRAPGVFFSALRPATHIPPHNGATNTRLTVHLPLIIPGGCGLRVGDEVREWKPGKVVMFDDTIRHEAWNRSDELRVVLIFDVWHPMLSMLERELVASTVEGIMSFYGTGADLGEL